MGDIIGLVGKRLGLGLVILLVISIIIFFMVGVFFWIVYDYTGVDAVLNGLPNAYYSVWACFFNSIFLLRVGQFSARHIPSIPYDFCGASKSKNCW